MFESFPIGIMNILLLIGILNLEEMQDSNRILLTATLGTIFKVIKELVDLFSSAYYLKEGYV